MLIHWLELLPITDRPDSLFEGIDLVFGRFKAGVWRLRDILRPLAFVDEQLRVDLLRRLVGRFPELTGQHEFYRTLSVVGAQTLDLLTDIAAGRLGKGNMRNATRHDYARQLYNGLTPELRGSLPGRFAEARDDGGKVFLGQMLAESEDLDAILMPMADPAGRKIMGSSYRISQDHIYTRQPLDEHVRATRSWRGVARLRAGLFDLTAAADQRVAAFAAACLTEVERPATAKKVLAPVTAIPAWHQVEHGPMSAQSRRLSHPVDRHRCAASGGLTPYQPAPGGANIGFWHKRAASPDRPDDRYWDPAMVCSTADIGAQSSRGPLFRFSTCALGSFEYTSMRLAYGPSSLIERASLFGHAPKDHPFGPALWIF